MDKVKGKYIYKSDTTNDYQIQRPKTYCLIEEVTGGDGWEDRNYAWIKESEVGGQKVVLEVPERLYKQIKKYEDE